MPKALVVYASRSGETEKIGTLIAEGLRMAGIETTVAKAGDIKTETLLEDCDALILGSATYHGDMIQSMKTLLFLAEKARLEGKIGAAFGAYGWSGEAPERIFGTMKHVFKMDMVGDHLRLKSAGLGGGVQMAQDYGRDIAKQLIP
jgi:NAD(P)H dehydrogenase (quinone)